MHTDYENLRLLTKLKILCNLHRIPFWEVCNGKCLNMLSVVGVKVIQDKIC